MTTKIGKTNRGAFRPPQKLRRARSASLLAAIAGACGSLVQAPAAKASTYYWDNTAGAGFGTASGTWNGNTTNWNTDSTGNATAGGAITATTDQVNFGTATTGLAAGNITVGTVNSGDINFGAASGEITLSGGTITLAATETTTVNNASDTISSALTGAGTIFNKAGNGTLILSGAGSTPAASFNIDAGTLQVTGGSIAIGTNFATNTNGAVLNGNYSQTGGNVTMGATSASVFLANNGGSTNFSVSGGNFTQAGTATNRFWLGTRGSGTTTVTVSGAGILSTNFVSMGDLSATVTSVLNIGDGGNFTGGSSIATGGTSGVLIAGTVNRATGNATLYFNGGTLKRVNTQPSNFLIDKNNPITNAYVSTAGGIIDNNSLSFTVNDSTVPLKHDPALGSTLDGGMVFQGSGNATSSGNNTYTGPTVIGSGSTLLLSGSFTNNLASSNAITVGSAAKLNVTGLTSGTLALASGQSLGGIGTVVGNTTVGSGSTISAGTSTTLHTGTGNTTGTLTTGNETWGKLGTYAVKINETNGTGTGVAGTGSAGSSTGWDEIAMGNLSVSTLAGGSGNTFAITLSSPAGAVSDFDKTKNYVWTIATIIGTPLTANTYLATAGPTGASISSVSNLFTLDTTAFVGSNPTLGSGSSFYLEALSSGGNETLEIGYNAAPEPGTALLILAGAGPILVRRRRRR